MESRGVEPCPSYSLKQKKSLKTSLLSPEKVIITLDNTWGFLERAIYGDYWDDLEDAVLDLVTQAASDIAEAITGDNLADTIEILMNQIREHIESEKLQKDLCDIKNQLVDEFLPNDTLSQAQGKRGFKKVYSRNPGKRKS
jgi:hypothetical protein